MENKIKKPLLIGHRGACGYLPEHTIESYKLAISMGADYIESDLVPLKDGVLIANHYGYLSTTTNVADLPEFVSKKRNHDFFKREDWFTEDFTLSEFKKLRAKQAFPGRNNVTDGLFSVPTFEEVLTLRQLESKPYRKIGVCPETKHPSYYNSIGLNFEEPLLALLLKYKLTSQDSPVFIQSFEADILKSLRDKIDVKFIMLLKKNFDLTLKDISKFGYGLGPDKILLLDEDGKDNGFVQKAHEFGLKVHPWTFKSDQLEKWFETPEDEYKAFLSLGIDGLFSDFSDIARKAIEEYY